MTRLLITGGTGFSGSALVDRIVQTTDWKIVSIERLPKGNSRDRLADVPKDRIERVYHDFLAELPDWLLTKLVGVDYIAHLGGAVQAIKSLENPELYVRSNVIGTFNMLEAARKLNPKVFLYTSSGEIFGHTPFPESKDENADARPSTPYSASKAAAEMLVHAYHRSFNVPTICTRTLNLFGKKRNAETYLPQSIKNILNGYAVTIHWANGEFGSRQWQDVEAYSDALLFLLDNGKVGETYHVAGPEKDNFGIVSDIALLLNRNLNFKAVDVSIHHPAHDLRFSINDDKIRDLGWRPFRTYEQAFEDMVRWTVENPQWLE
jgi:dTDP-glucose 4,6-dehydratase